MNGRRQEIAFYWNYGHIIVPACALSCEIVSGWFKEEEDG